MSEAPVLTVIVLAFEGGDWLRKCLASIERQHDQSFTLDVVQTPAAASDDPDAVAEALQSVTTPWVTLLLDRSELSPDWTAVFTEYSGCSDVGAIGGPLRVFEGPSTIARWYARGTTIAWFSLGVDESHLLDFPHEEVATDVAFLSGHNMAIRIEIARAAVHGRTGPLAVDHELEWALTVKAAGLRVMFDSRLERTLHKESRPTECERGTTRLRAWNHGYALTHALSKHGTLPHRLRALGTTMLIGTRRSPGLLAFPVFALRPFWRRRWSAAMLGKTSGLLDALRGR